METLVAALVVGTAGVLAALIQRSDRHHQSAHDDLRRQLSDFRGEFRQELRTLTLCIDRLYDRPA